MCRLLFMPILDAACERGAETRKFFIGRKWINVVYYSRENQTYVSELIPMSHPALRLLPAVVWHMASLLSFHHDGRGLPRLGSFMLVWLVGLKLALSCLVVSMMLPDVGVAAGLVKSLVAAALLYGVAFTTRQSYAFSGYLLLWSSVDVGLIGLNLVVGHVPGEFITTCYAWGLLAYIGLLFRAAPQNETDKH